MLHVVSLFKLLIGATKSRSDNCNVKNEPTVARLIILFICKKIHFLYTQKKILRKRILDFDSLFQSGGALPVLLHLIPVPFHGFNASHVGAHEGSIAVHGGGQQGFKFQHFTQQAVRVQELRLVAAQQVHRTFGAQLDVQPTLNQLRKSRKNREKKRKDRGWIN